MQENTEGDDVGCTNKKGEYNKRHATQSDKCVLFRHADEAARHRRRSTISEASYSYDAGENHSLIGSGPICLQRSLVRLPSLTCFKNIVFFCYSAVSVSNRRFA